MVLLRKLRSRRFGFATMKTVEDANAVIEKLNDTEIGGRKIKVNITEKPLGVDSSMIQAEEPQFVDSPHKVYIGNLAKTVTSDVLKDFFSESGNVLGAKVQRTPGTSKSSGFGFVSFSSNEEVEAAIAALNNAVLEGQKIRVNKA
ncbi:30S ribosomal protein 2 chloroplastic [Bienertia sinuspersici]